MPGDIAMGRKHNLQERIQRYCYQQEHRQDGIVTIRERQRVMNTIIDDLANLKQLPTSLERLSTKHIEVLVLHWRHKGISTATIGNKLGACNLRGYVLKPLLLFTVGLPTTKKSALFPLYRMSNSLA